MKFSAAIAVLCSILAVSQTQMFGPMVGMGSEKCVDSGECPAGQCCAGMTPFSGVCRPFAKEGMSCKADNLYFTGIYKVTCPCDADLECVETTVGEKTKSTCQVPPSPPTTVAPVPADEQASSGESPESSQESKSSEQSSETDEASSGESGPAQSEEAAEAASSQETAQEEAADENEASQEKEAQENAEAESAGSDVSNAAE